MRKLSNVACFLLAAIAASISCGGCQRRQPVEYAGRTEQGADDYYGRQRLAVDAWERRSTILTTCNGVEAAPSMQGDQLCGTVFAEVFTDTYRAWFASTLCASAMDETCETKLLEMFVARVQERYGLADYEVVSRYCKAWPHHCLGPQNMELVVLRSHNDGVRQTANEHRTAILARSQAEFAERERVRLEAEDAARREEAAQWAAVFKAMERPKAKQTKCTTTRNGNTANTNCTTY